MSQHFSTWTQLLAIGTYVGTDVLLRFMYSVLLYGEPGMQNNNNNNEDNTQQQLEAYNKPVFISWCCYNFFALVGLAVVMPYLYFVRRISIIEYWTNEWCGSLPLVKACACCFIVVICILHQNVFYVLALKYVSAPISAALCQTEAPLTVCLSVLVLHRFLGNRDKAGVIVCLTGIFLIVVPPVFINNNNSNDAAASEGQGGDNDNNNEDDANEDSASLSHVARMLFGCLFSTLSAVMYAGYQIFWQYFDDQRFPPPKKRRVKELNGDSTSSTPAVVPKPADPVSILVDAFASLAMIGVLNFTLGWIAIPLAHVTRIEHFELPPASHIGLIACTSFLSAMVDVSSAVACIVSSAVLVAMSYPLNIPFSVLLLRFWDGTPMRDFGTLGWIGTGCVILGIFFLETDAQQGCDCWSNDDMIDDDNIEDFPFDAEKAYGDTSRTELNSDISMCDFESMGLPDTSIIKGRSQI